MILLEKVGEEEERQKQVCELLTYMSDCADSAETRAMDADGDLKAYYLGRSDAWIDAWIAVANELQRTGREDR